MALTRDDLNDLRDSLTQRIDKGFDGVNERLDLLNGRTRSNEQDIAVLKDRDTQSAKTHAYVAGALGAFLTAAAEALRHYLAK